MTEYHDRHADEREADFRATAAHFVKARRDRRIWISTGALIGLVAIACILILVSVFVVAPAARKATSASETAAALKAAGVTNQRNGMKLLHTFDCTYGRATVKIITEAERSRRASAKVALRTYHLLLQSHRTRLARIQLTQYRTDTRTATVYRDLRNQLRPLDGGGPC